MKLWLDAHLSPALAPWIERTFPGLHVQPLRSLGLRDAADLDVFKAAREHDAVIVSKDADFAELLRVHGSPPMVIWLTCGNTSNAHLRKLLIGRLPQALELLRTNEALVEIR